MTRIKSKAGADRASSDHAQRIYNLRGFVDSLGIGAGVVSVFMSIVFSDLLGLSRPYMIAGSAILAGICTGDIVSLYLRGKLSLGTTATITFTGNEVKALTGKEIHELREALGDLTNHMRVAMQDPQAANAKLLRESRGVINQARVRLLQNSSQIDKRSRVSLVTGSSITVIAVVILLAFAFPPIPLSSLSWQQLLSTYLPKLGVIVMLEVFAFFFLRLYKASLSESRTVHADLNALALREAALIAAWAESDEQRLHLAQSLIKPAPQNVPSADDPNHGVDPKVLAELVASISKLLRG